MICLPKRFRFEGNKQVGADRNSRPEHIREAWKAPCAGLAPTVSTCSISTASIRPFPSRRWPTRSVIWSSRGSYDFRSFRGWVRQNPLRPCRPSGFRAAERIFSALPTATFRTGIVTANGSGQVALHDEAFDDFNLRRNVSGMGTRRITEPSAKLL